MSKKGNGILVVGGVLAALIFLPDILGSKQSGTTETSGLLGGNLPSLDLSGLLGGNQSGGISDFLGNLAGGLNSIFSGIKMPDFSGIKMPDFSGIKMPDFSGIINPPATTDTQGNSSAPGGPGATGEAGKYPPSYPNTLPNIFYSAGSLADAIGKTALIGAGTYVGLKVISPALPGIGNAVKGVFSRFGGGGGDIGVTGGLGIRALLASPVSEVPLAMTIGSVALAGAVGYGAGTLFNKTPPGKWLIEQSGNLGAKVAAGNNPVQNVLFPHAQVVKTSPNASGGLAKYGYTIADVQASQKKGITGAAFVNNMIQNPKINVNKTVISAQDTAKGQQNLMNSLYGGGYFRK